MCQGTQGPEVLQVSQDPGLRNSDNIRNGVWYTLWPHLFISPLSLSPPRGFFPVYLLNSSFSFSFTMYIVENQYSHIDQCAFDPWISIIISLKFMGIFESELQIPKERESGWPSFGQGIG